MAHDHSAPSAHPIVPGFGADRAAHYDTQAAASLAGGQAMYELGASALASQLDGHEAASLLFVGLGTGAELVPYNQFDVPGWRFTGVDPSDAMLAVARRRLAAEGLLSRTHLHVGELHSLPPEPPFDGAQMLGVLHHVPVGCRVGMDPALWDVELRRWRAHGIPQEELERRRQGLMMMRFIESDAALFELFAQTGLVAPRPIFVSLQFKVFLVRCEPSQSNA